MNLNHSKRLVCVAISDELLLSHFSWSWNRRPHIWLAIERQRHNRTMFVEFLLSQKESRRFRRNSSMWEHTLDWFDSTHVTHFTNEYSTRENYLLIPLTHARVVFFFCRLLLFWNFFPHFSRRRDTQSTLRCNTKYHRTGRIGLDEENRRFEFLFFSQFCFITFT